jgi:hypothetical protein
MDVDPIEDAAHPTGTHAVPGQAGERRAGDTSSGEEDIVEGKNPTQRKIEAERRQQGPDLPATPRTKPKKAD